MRNRHEHQIRLLDSTFGCEFDKALTRVVGRRNRALDFFTDEQIAEIRAEMIEREWSRHIHVRDNRKRRAA